MPLKTQLLCLLFGTLIGMVALQLIYFNRISGVIYDKNNEYTSEIMANVETSMIDEVDSINRVISAIAYNGTIQQFLLEENNLRKYSLFTETTALLERMKSVKKGVVDFVLVGTNGNNVNLGYDAQVQAEFGEIIERRLRSALPGTGIQYIGVRQMPYMGGEGYYVVAAAPIRGIVEGAHYGDVVGYLFLLVDPVTLSRRIEDISEKTTGYFYLLDSENAIMASNDTSRIGLWAGEPGNRYIVTTKEISEVGFTMMSLLPKQELYRGIEVVRTDILLLLAILLIILLVVYLLIARNLVQPLAKLFHFINAVRLNHRTALNERVDLDGYMEIHVLAAKFNQMLDEISQLTTELVDSNTRVYELQLLRKQAEIAFLNSQINPHFLYNTLECIQGIAASRNVQEINTMTSALSRIFRYSIQEHEEVTLREELDIVRRYLDIQQIRFDDRFEVEFDIEESLLEIKVKKMLLQPLVENAVFHGLELKLEKGHLLIGVREESPGELTVVVRDDGAGIPPARLEEIRELLSRKGSAYDIHRQNKHGIGVANVSQRIQGAYGDPFGLTIDSVEHQGTQVTLRLPGRGASHVHGHAG